MAVASLTVPGGQELHFPHFFLKSRLSFLTFSQTLLIFFFFLAHQVGESPTREGPDYATDFFIPPKTFLKVYPAPIEYFPLNVVRSISFSWLFFLCVLDTLSQVRGLHCSLKKTNKQTKTKNKQTNKTKNSFFFFSEKKNLFSTPPNKSCPQCAHAQLWTHA